MIELSIQVKCTHIDKKGEKYVKNKYDTPEMEVIEFETEDIITASGGELTGSDDLPFVPRK